MESTRGESKRERGIKLFLSLPPEFNIYPVVSWDTNTGVPVVDYEALVDWFTAQQEREHERLTRIP